MYVCMCEGQGWEIPLYYFNCSVNGILTLNYMCGSIYKIISCFVQWEQEVEEQLCRIELSILSITIFEDMCRIKQN